MRAAPIFNCSSRIYKILDEHFLMRLWRVSEAFNEDDNSCAIFRNNAS